MKKEPSALLEIENFSLSYKNSPYGLKNISLSLNKNEILGLTGASGSGKSTLAKAILNLPGFDTEASISGKLLFLGQNIHKLSNKEMRQLWKHDLSVIFQDSLASLNPFMRIKTQIFEVLNHIPKNERLDVALKLLEEVHIQKPDLVLNCYPHELSGGMRQRVMIVLALAKKPKLLILDEPTTALDPTVQASILRLLQDLKQNHEMAMIFISHDLGVLAGIADKMAIMENGKLIELQNASEFFKAPNHPFSQTLLEAFKQIRSYEST